MSFIPRRSAPALLLAASLCVGVVPAAVLSTGAHAAGNIAITDLSSAREGSQHRLSATATDSAGAETAVSFREAQVSLPTEVTNATGTDLPASSALVGDIVSASGLLPDDGEVVASDASGDLTFQQFDIEVADLNVANLQAQWSGVVDPQRMVSLYLWNTSTGAWDLVAESRGTADGNTALSAPASTAHVDGDVVHALVVGSDPMADDINKPVDEAFLNPADYDFAMVHHSDTQYLMQYAVEKDSPIEREAWNKAYTDTTQWIADNAAERKIVYSAHTGDLIDNWTHPEDPEDQARQEWELASAAQKILDDAGVPNGVTTGNHDNKTGTTSDLYNEYFGPDRYEALSAGWENAEYGGPWRPGDNENHYDLFTAGGLDFVVVYLGFVVDDEEIAWANEIFERYSDRNGILATHGYLNVGKQRDGRDAPYSSTDGRLFETVVEKNENVFLVLSGHHNGIGIKVVNDVGETNHSVVELFSNFQYFSATADDLGLTGVGGYAADDLIRFGSSFFRMLQFDVERSELTVDTYSPYLDSFKPSEYDVNQRFDDVVDDFTVPIDLTSRSTSIDTDSIALVSLTNDELGSETVASGAVASVLVDQGAADAWYVVATSDSGAATSPVQFLEAITGDNGDSGTGDDAGTGGDAGGDGGSDAGVDGDADAPGNNGRDDRPTGLPNTGD